MTNITFEEKYLNSSPFTDNLGRHVKVGDVILRGYNEYYLVIKFNKNSLKVAFISTRNRISMVLMTDFPINVYGQYHIIDPTPLLKCPFVSDELKSKINHEPINLRP